MKSLLALLSLLTLLLSDCVTHKIPAQVQRRHYSRSTCTTTACTARACVTPTATADSPGYIPTRSARPGDASIAPGL